jgi:hypothetical protein
MTKTLMCAWEEIRRAVAVFVERTRAGGAV